MEIYFWRPRSLPSAALAKYSPTFRARHRPSPRGRMNFGDELGPLIVDRVLSQYGIKISDVESNSSLPGTFFSVGSVTHVARNGDTIWGSGVLGGIKRALAKGVHDLQIFAVRGPMTRQALVEGHGIKEVPHVFGDPALLFPDLFPEIQPERLSNKVLVVTHINDDRPEIFSKEIEIVSANCDPLTMANKIADAPRVVTSSLHGKILADAYGVPSVLFQGKKTHPFKYHDYSFAVSGEPALIYPSLGSALRATPGVCPDLLDLKEKLLKSFPAQIFF